MINDDVGQKLVDKVHSNFSGFLFFWNLKLLYEVFLGYKVFLKYNEEFEAFPSEYYDNFTMPYVTSIVVIEIEI